MSSPRPRRKETLLARKHEDVASSSARASTLDENVHAIKRWEDAILLARSRAERVSDWIACTAGKGPVLVLHVVWFGVWVTINAGAIRHSPLRSLPIPVLDHDGLAGGHLPRAVRARQPDRLARQADKRSHLDLQIDLLAEREMTAVLQLLRDIAQHLTVQTTVTPEQLRDLMTKTDLRRLTDRMEELAEPATAVTSPTS